LGAKFGILMAGVSRRGPAVGYGWPGVPKKVAISQGFKPGTWNDWRAGQTKLLVNYYGASVAHELFHCCNVAHHGDLDRGPVAWHRSERRKPDGTVTPGVTEVALDADNNYAEKPGTEQFIPAENFHWEAEQMSAGGISVSLAEGIVPVELLPERAYVACQGGQHSGYQDCVMRYDVATAYIPKDKPLFRYLFEGSELRGSDLCDRKEDMQIDFAGTTVTIPKSGRYGDATNGFCKSQICVNDAHHR
jgi:hypothetical protein